MWHQKDRTPESHRGGGTLSIVCDFICSGKVHVQHAGGHPDDQAEGEEEGTRPILLPG